MSERAGRRHRLRHGLPLSLQPCHSDSSIANTNNTSSLSELLNSSDLLSEFQFNPDTLLSPSAFPFPDDMLDGLTGLDHGCCEIMGSPQTPVNTTSADDEIKHLLGQDSQDSMEMDCIRDLLPENTLQFSAELSRVSSSNEGSPAATPRCVGTPAQVSSPGSQASPCFRSEQRGRYTEVRVFGLLAPKCGQSNSTGTHFD